MIKGIGGTFETNEMESSRCIMLSNKNTHISALTHTSAQVFFKIHSNSNSFKAYVRRLHKNAMPTPFNGANDKDVYMNGCNLS